MATQKKKTEIPVEKNAPSIEYVQRKSKKEIEHVDNATATIELRHRRAYKKKRTLWQQKNDEIGLFLSFEAVDSHNKFNQCDAFVPFTTQRLLVFHMVYFYEIVSRLWISPLLNFFTWEMENKVYKWMYKIKN